MTLHTLPSDCSHVTTIINGKGNPNLSKSNAEQAFSTCCTTKSTGFRWLNDGVALDIFHSQSLGAEQIDQLRTALEAAHGWPVDIISQPQMNRRKKLLISDMDSTLIEQECIDELADAMGIKAHIAAITERAMNGEMDFQAALKERVLLLKELSVHRMQSVLDERITLMPGALTLAHTMKAHRAHLMVVSGGFSFFTVAIRDALGFDGERSNRLDIVGDQLSGMMHEPIFDQHGKLAALRETMAERNLSPQDVLAVGDGANDLLMLQAVQMGVAYHAKPVVQQQVANRINHHDLSALLYIQGYLIDEWVA